jgi:hypothetical protein
VNILHAHALHGRYFLAFLIIDEVDNGLYTERREIVIILAFRLRATIVIFIDLPKVLDVNAGRATFACLMNWLDWSGRLVERKSNCKYRCKQTYRRRFTAKLQNTPLLHLDSSIKKPDDSAKSGKDRLQSTALVFLMNVVLSHVYGWTIKKERATPRCSRDQ